MTDQTPIPFLNKTVAGKPVTHDDLPAASGIANTAHVNHIANFFKAIGHGIKDIFLWAPSIGEKTVKVIQESEQLTPDFIIALKAFVSDGAAIVASAASVAATKGANIGSDYNVLTGIENLIADFNKYYPLLQSAINDLSGIILNDAPVMPAPVITPPPVTNVVTPEMLGANAPGAETNVVTPGTFVPKQPK